MMSHHRPKQNSIYMGLMVIGLLILTIALAGRPALAGVLPQTAYQQLQAVWQRAGTVGEYDYHSNILQTTTPVTTLRNVGRGPQTQRIRIDGNLDKAADTMLMELQINHQPPLSIKIADGQAYGRQGADGDWTELEQSPDFFTPGGDPLGFLVAMEKVRALSPGEEGMEDFSTPAELLPAAYRADESISRYAFDLSGPKFASFLKGQMEAELRSKGELPPSLRLSSPAQYVAMTGHGEIWVNGDGLPVRQLLHLDLPEGIDNSGPATADLVTTFANWADASESIRSQLWHNPTRFFTQPTIWTGLSAQQLQQLGLSLGMTMFLMGIAAFAVTHRRRWGVSVAVYSIIILSMLLTPLLQTQQVSAFYDGQQARALETAATDVETVESSTFNPHENPVQAPVANNAGPAKTLEMANAAAESAPAASNAVAATAQITVTCTVTETSDCDGDGLIDQIEIYQLGTMVDAIDTDGDNISDKAEIQPFVVGGQTWYLDPLKADSNGDGYPDSIECPIRIDYGAGKYEPDNSYPACRDTDGDGTPDVYDFDNDGDGVPDSVDSAPDSVQAVTNGRFGFALTGYTAEHSLIANLVIRPTDDSHLWWANSVLDWPDNDQEGQIQRRTDDTLEGGGDMRLAPLLEVTIPYNSANPTRGLPVQADVASGAVAQDTSLDEWLDRDRLNAYNIIATGPGDDGEIILYAPLNTIKDEVGETPVAFGATLLYEMAGSATGWGDNHQMRLLWSVNGLNDSCEVPDGLSEEESATYCEDDVNWTSRQSVLQTYYDDFTVTGLAVEEHRGATGMIVAPQSNSAVYERDLWHLVDTLSATYLEAEQVNNTRLALADIPSHLSAWGISAGDLYVQTYIGLHDETALIDALSGDEVISVLEAAHPTPADGTVVNLLFAGEETTADVPMAADEVTFADNAFTVDLSNAEEQITGNVRWNPYHYAAATTYLETVTDPETGIVSTIETVDARWDELNVTTYLAQLQSDLAMVLTKDLLVAANLATADDDATLVNDGAAQLATNYYLAQYLGVPALLDDSPINPVALIDADHVKSAEPALTIVARLVAELQKTFVQKSLANLAIETGALADESGAQLVANTMWQELATVPGVLLTSVGSLAIGDISSSAAQALITVAGPPVPTAQINGAAYIDVAALHIIPFVESSAKLGFQVAKLGILSLQMRQISNIERIMDVWDASVREAINAGNTGLKDTFIGYRTATKAQIPRTARTVSKWATVGLAVEITAIAAFATYTILSEHLEPGSADFNQVLAVAYAQAIVAVMTYIIFVLLAGTPGVNLIFIGLLIFDAAIALGCDAAGVKQENIHQWGYWVCGGFTGALTKAIAFVVNDTTLLTDITRTDHINVTFDDLGLTVANDVTGMAVGNTLNMTASITATAYAGHPTWMGYSYPYQLDDDNVKQGNINVRLQNSATNFEDSLLLGGTTWQNPPNKTFDLLPPHDGPRGVVHFQRTGSFTFDEAGVNISPAIYFSEAVKVKQQDCWLYVGPPLFVPIPICQTATNFDDTFHQRLGDYIITDVFPGSVDDFHTLAADVEGEPGIRLAWDDTFPVLRDADGDGLISKAFNGPDPDDSNPDTDADGLSDFYEVENGFDPTAADADCDGLIDYWEAFYGTNPAQADSDYDGLIDSREVFHPNQRYPYENSVFANTNVPTCAADNGLTARYVGGWDIVYAFEGNTPLRLWMSADPNNADTDDDGLTDKQEQVYGYSPHAPSELDVLTLETTVSTSSGLDSYVGINDSISYTATVTNDLNNKYLRGLLESEFPVDTIIKTQSMGVLKPLAETTMTGNIGVAAAGITASTATSMTLRAGVNVATPDDYLLWLRMNDVAGSTTLVDSSTYGNDATAPNVTTNGAYAYLPANATIESVAAEMPAGMSGLTLGVWFKVTALGASQTQVLLGSKVAGGDYANSPNILIAGGKLAATILPGNTAVVANGASLSLNEWHHATATFSGSETDLYLDGVLVASGTGVGLPSEPHLFYSTGDSPFYIDDVEVLSKALDASEIRAFYGRELAAFDLTATSSNVSCVEGRCPTMNKAGATFDQTQHLTVDTSGLSFNNQFSIGVNIKPESRPNRFSDAAGAAFGIDTSQDWQGVYGFRDPSNDTLIFPSLYLGSKGALRVVMGDGSKICTFQTANGLYKFGEERHVITSFDGSTFTIFIDGEARASGTGTNCANMTVPNMDQLYVGRPNSFSYYHWERAFFDYLSDSGGTAELCLTFDDNSTAGAIWHDYNVDVSSTAKSTDLPIPLGISKRLADEGVHWFRFHEDDSSSDNCNYSTSANDDEFVYRSELSSASGLGIYETSFNNDSDQGTLYWSLANEFFLGTLRNLRIYDYAFSAAGAERVYNAETVALQMPFDEAPGVNLFADRSGNYFEVSCTATSCPDSGIPGRDNQALRFDGGIADDDGNDGVADFLSLNATDVALGLSENNFTVAAWVKPDSVSSQQMILSAARTNDSSGADSDGFGFGLNRGKPWFITYSVKDYTATNTVLPAGVWSHVAAVMDANNTVHFYVNGTLVESITSSQPMRLNSDDSYRIGSASPPNSSAASEPFDGRIDDVRVLKYAARAAAVQGLMNEAPLLNLHLDEDLNTTSFADDSLLANAATCSGTTCPGAGDKGQMRESATFDGIDDKLTVPGTESLGLDTYTVALWVKPTKQNGGAQPLIYKGTADQSQRTFGLYLLRNSLQVGQRMHQSDCATGLSVDSTGSLLANQWNHVVTTFDGTQQTLYINGAPAGAVAYSGTPCQNSGAIQLGASTFSSHSPFAGNLDEVTVEEGALSAAQVKARYSYQAAWYDEKQQHAILVDADAPTVALTLGDGIIEPGQVLYIDAADPTVNGVASGLASVEYSINGGAFVDAVVDNDAYLIPATATAALGEGNQTIQVRATDNVGLSTTSNSATIGIDLTAPTLTINDGQEGGVKVVRVRTLSLSGTALDQGSVRSGIDETSVQTIVRDHAGNLVSGPVAGKFNVGTAAANEWRATHQLTTNPYGRYTIEVTVKDKAGNEQQSSRTLWLDGTSGYADMVSDSNIITGTDTVIGGFADDIPYPTVGRTLHMHFEEGPDDTFYYDSSPNHLNATCGSTGSPTGGSTGSPTGGCPGDEEFGVDDSAVRFGGVDYLVIGDQTGLSGAQALGIDGDFTIMSWVRVGTLNGTGRILAAERTLSNDGIGFGLNGDKLILSAFGVKEYITTQPTGLALGEWSHVAASYDATTDDVTFYVNGEVVETVAGDIDIVPNLDEPYRIGGTTTVGSADLREGLNGALDELAVYSTNLSDEEIYNIANRVPNYTSQIKVRYRHAGGSVWPQLNPDGVALYLPLDDQIGVDSFEDLSIYGQDAVCNSDESCPTASFIDPEKHFESGRYLTMDGVDDYLTIPNVLDPATTDFTAALWFDATSLSNNSVLLQQADGSGTGRSWISLLSGGTVRTLLSGSVLDHPTKVGTFGWHHVALTYEHQSQTLTLYLDGVPTSATRTMEASDGAMLLGVHKSLTANFNGFIDEVAIFERALSATEIGYLQAEPWYDASPAYDATDSSDKLRAWSHTVPTGLEGPYKIDLMTIEGDDAFGRKQVTRGVWTGVIDTLAPRVTFEYIPDAGSGNAQVRCTAVDDYLTETGWVCPVDDSYRTATYQDAAWYTARLTDTLNLIGLTTSQETVTVEPNPTMTACDLFGNCRSTGDGGDTPIIDNDADNIPDAIEDGAPNGGDGNGDGVLDSQQANVTSLPDASDTAGEYVTLASPSGTELVDVSVRADAPATVPEGASFPIGHLDFSVQNVPAGGAVTVTLFPKDATRFNTYYKYGATPDDGSEHWYEFLYQQDEGGSTGAEIFADRIVLHFVDGGRGDADLTANGVIVDPGAPAFFLSATELPFRLFLPVVSNNAQMQAQAVAGSAVEQLEAQNEAHQALNETEVTPQQVELTHKILLPLVVKQ